MCGLTGFFSLNAHTDRTTYQHKKAFMQQMLYLSALRGRDSTGLALCNMRNAIPDMLYKRAMESSDFLQLDRTGALLTAVDDALVVLGHTRSKTVGNVGDDEAHPFKYEHITMIHNGSVTNYKSLLAKDDSCDVQTDSAHIAYSMAYYGAKETLEKLNGAFCIAWYDALEKTFNIARNEERPLYFIEVPAWKGLAFASELGMLASTLDRIGIKCKGKFLWPQEYQILTWKTEPSASLEYKTTPFAERPSRQIHSQSGTRPGGTNKQISGQPTAATTGGQGQLTLSGKETTVSTTLINSGKHTTPASKKAIAKATQRLQKHKIPYNSTWKCFTKDWIPYKSNRTNVGCLVCELDGTFFKGMEVLIHNIKRSVWEKFKEPGKNVLVSIVNVKEHEGHEVFIGMPFYNGALQAVIDTEKRSTKKTVKPVEEDTSGKEQTAQYRGPFGVLYTKDEWLTRTADGCCVCNVDLEFKDHESIVWFGQAGDFPVCGDCAEDEVLLGSCGLVANKH